MNFTDIFVRRPVLATVISLMILVIGLRAIALLDLREYPETESSVIVVTTIYPGADGDQVQSFITVPLQRAISEAEGIDYITSSSTQGVSIIQAYMELNYDPNAAVAEVQAKVASQRNILPEDAKDPVIDKRSSRGFSLMYFAFSSTQMNPAEITDYLLRGVIPKFQAVPGVAKAQIMGNQSFAMRIWLDPRRMAAHGITAPDVRDALRNNNFLAGVGQTKGDYVAVNLGATTDIATEEDFRKLVVRSDGPTLVRLRDVAEVKLGAKNSDMTSWYNGDPAIMVAIEQAPGGNPLVIAEDLKSLLPDIERQLPAALKMTLPHDGSEDIEASIDEVIRTLIEAIIIVLLVIYLSLGSWHAAIVPAVSVPLSLIGAAFVMLIMGFSINLLTLLAMLLAIGLVVDDAIVVVENVHRHIARGETPFDAALKGARELALPIVSMTTTLLAVYAPIGFMGGLVGILFTEFAFALVGAVLISGIVALTFSPMLSSKILNTSDKPERFETAVEHFFENLSARYKRSLSNVLDFQPVTMVFALVMVGSIYFMFATSTTELAPVEDRSRLSFLIKAPETATIEYTKAYGRNFVDTLMSEPDFLRTFMTLGGGGSPATTFGGMRLKLPEDRKSSQSDIQRNLQTRVNKIAGFQIAVFPMINLPGNTGGLPVQFVITTDQDYGQLDRLADEMIGTSMASGNFVYMSKSIKFTQPRTHVVIDRDRAGDLGIDMRDIGSSLATLLGENNVNRFSLAGRSYEVIPQVAREFRQDHKMLEDYYLRSSSGDLVSLASMVAFERTVEPSDRTQFQELNAVTLNGIMAPGVSLGDALAYMEATAAELFPREFSYDYTGASRQFKNEGSALVLTFFMSLLIIYLVLAAQFESWRDPLIILISVPMSIAGALIFITLGLATINIYTQIGLITLIGLIAKNGILIVDFSNRLMREQGMDKRSAVQEAAAVRLRPILMTTVAMMMAMIPLLIADGPGAISRVQIGLVIVTGLGIGTLFTLFVVPSFYLLLAREHEAAPDLAGPDLVGGDRAASTLS